MRAFLESDEAFPYPLPGRWKKHVSEAFLEVRARMAATEPGADASTPVKPPPRLRRWYLAAAAVAAMAAAAWVLGSTWQGQQPPRPTAREISDLPPGGNHAVLTLAGGEKILLNGSGNGVIARQGTARVIRKDSARLVYSAEAAPAVPVYNTVTTPPGGQYRVVLSDGTRVWLNAASSLRFPSAFSSDKREVSLTGEAYFEVAREKSAPFTVRANGLRVDVLGTDFDMMTYDQEPAAKVTLVEGAVRVTAKQQRVTLAPGEQAWLEAGTIHRVAGADVAGATAWTRNRFWFNDADISEVMRTLSRWYDVAVEVRGNIPQHFDGQISRDMPVSRVFEALEATTHLHYRIQEGKIIVSP